MNTHHTSRRARRYPAAGAAMRGFVVIERLPAAHKGPQSPIIMWPDYVGGYRITADSEENTPAQPLPREIDLAWQWVQPCKWMWQDKNDQTDWQMFMAYSHGVPVQDIADRHLMSRVCASKRLDSIFYQIQVEAGVEKLTRQKS